jgi:ATP-dependent protease ClpP protease subunit
MIIDYKDIELSLPKIYKEKKVTTNNDYEFSLPFGSNTNKRVFKDKKNNTINIFVYDEIGHISQYIEEVRALQKAKEDTTVNIFLASLGGSLDTTASLVEIIRGCKGTTNAIVSYAASGGTAIALACDKVSLHKHSYFMLHNFSGGDYGKGKERRDRAVFEYKWTSKFFSDIYLGFLTAEELTSMQEDDDFWMLADEVEERLIKIGKFNEL